MSDRVDNVLGGEVGLRPVVDDPDTAPIFEAASEGRLVVQTCADCGHQQMPPRVRCRSCRGQDFSWDDLPQEGTVHTWTVVEHQINPAFPVPYTAVLVDVMPRGGMEPVRFLGHLAGAPEIAVGDPVRATFIELADGITVPNWELDNPATTSD